MGDKPLVGVLGAGGFLGRSLVATARRLDLVQIRALKRCQFDLSDPTSWGDSLRDVDCVVNCAARIDGSTLDVFATNTLNMNYLCDHLRTLKVKKFIELSTGAVYGHCHQPTSPSHGVSPSGDYPISKFLAEQILDRSYHGTLNILRLYCPWGEQQKMPRLIPRLVREILAGRALHCRSCGGPRLSLTHVDDISEVIIRDFVLKDNCNRITNIASNFSYSIEEIAWRIGEVVGVTPCFEFCEGQGDLLSVPYTNHDWLAFNPDSRFIRAMLIGNKQ